MRFCCIGLNHRHAPLEVRERFAVASDRLPEMLDRLSANPSINEVFAVSTCNRFEVYAVFCPTADVETAVSDAIGTLAEGRTERTSLLRQHAEVRRGVDALAHLFRVASSLDSMVLGDAQILGQVKEAWTLAQRTGTVGPLLHRAIERSLRTAKRVRTETKVGEGGVSISWVAVQLAKRIFANLSDCRVLVLGAGEMAELAALHLKDNGAKDVTIANRTFARAERIAADRGWRAKPLEDLSGLLKDADIVIASTGSPTPIINAKHVRKALRRRYQPLFFIDIAVPRDVESDVADLDGTYLYNIDDLQAVADQNLERRGVEAERGLAIIHQEVGKFGEWLSKQSVAPTIAALRQRLMDIRSSELARSERMLSSLSPAQREAVEKLTAAMVSKVMAGPVQKLKDAGGSSKGAAMAVATRDLFDLTPLAVIDDDSDAEEGTTTGGEAESSTTR